MAIVANLIVFLALLAFLDATIEYCGELIGYPGWSFEVRNEEKKEEDMKEQLR